MKSGWQTVPFGNVLEPVSRPTLIVPDDSYRILGMRWYAQGLFLKEEKFGNDIRAKELFRVEKEDFVYNRLFAWKGSFGIVGADTAGGYVSGEFPCFRVRRDRAEPKFLHLYLSQQRIWDDIARNSTGQTNISRLRLKEADFLRMVIPLPPLSVQRGIVARVEALARLVEEARGLRRAATKENDGLLRSILFRHPVTALTTVSDLVTLREPNVLVQPQETYEFAGVYSFGKGVFRSGRKLGMDFSYKRLTRLKTGNFVYPKLMAWEGALGIVPPECDGLVVSTEFPVFEVDEDRVLSETLDVYFRSPNIWPTLSAGSTGTNLRRRRLNPRDFLRLKISVPPRAVQFKLRDVNLKCKDLHALQGATEKKLDALMPSILAEVFAGELK